MVTTFNLRLDESAPAGITLPAGALAAWNTTNPNAFGANAKMLDELSAGTSQLSAVRTIGSTGTIAAGCAQFCSKPLAAQTINAANWAMAFAASVLATSTGWSGFAALFLVNGTTGAVRSTIFALGTPTGSSTGRLTANTELTVFSTTSAGSSVTASAGDYLCLEVGAQETNTSGSNAIVYTNGTTTISSDAAATSSALSTLTAPVALTFQGGSTPAGGSMLLEGVGK